MLKLVCTRRSTVLRLPLQQGILKGQVLLYHWPPVWLVWISLFYIQKLKKCSCHNVYSKPDKQEVESTTILPPLVFPGWGNQGGRGEANVQMLSTNKFKSNLFLGHLLFKDLSSDRNLARGQCLSKVLRLSFEKRRDELEAAVIGSDGGKLLGRFCKKSSDNGINN